MATEIQKKGINKFSQLGIFNIVTVVNDQLCILSSSKWFPYRWLLSTYR